MPRRKSPARILRSKGLIPPDWNLRKLSSGQKSYITKQAKKYAQVVKKPDEYVSRRAGADTLRKLAKADYPVKHGRVLLHVPGKDRVSVRSGRIEFIRRRQTERVYVEAGPDFLARLASLPQRKLPRGQYVGFKFRDSNIIGTFDSVRDALTYATARRGFTSAELQAVSLVAINTNDGWEDDEDGED